MGVEIKHPLFLKVIAKSQACFKLHGELKQIVSNSNLYISSSLTFPPCDPTLMATHGIFFWCFVGTALSEEGSANAFDWISL